ncbi:MAG: helix-turn-helix domain-containing protein [Pseudomonadota bacterium]
MSPDTAQTQNRLIEGDQHTLAVNLSDLFIELDVVAQDRSQQGRVEVETQLFGDMELLRTYVTRGRFSVVRSEQLVAQSASNNYFLACILGGIANLSQASRDVSLQPSDLAVLDSTRPYRIDVNEYLDALWIRVPRHRLEGRMQSAVEILAQRVDGRSGVGHLASSLITAALREAGGLTSSESLRISNALLDLLSLSLEVSTGHTDRRPLHILRKVQNYIDANISDPDLCRRSIALRHGISERYLSRLFEKEGLSVAKWIRLRRLEQSRLQLESPDQQSRGIGEIAFACGFSDVSSFNRAFKRHFGATPSSLRRIAIPTDQGASE